MKLLKCMSRKTIVPAVTLGVLMIAPTAASSRPVKPQSNTFSLGFSSRDDAFEPVPWSVISAGSGGITTAFTADTYGDTGFSTFAADQPLTLRFEETLTTGIFGTFQATTIGQQFTLSSLDLAEYINSSTTYYFCQPKARLISIDSASDPLAPISDAESGWYVTPHVDIEGTIGDFLFEAWIAELPTKGSIDRYFAFSTGSHTSEYMHGVLFRLESDVDLGETGFNLAIDTAGYSYGTPSNPKVGSIYVGPNSGGNGMVATLLGFEADTLFVHVSGELRQGDNLVLVADPRGGNRSRAPDMPTVTVYPSTASTCPPDSPMPLVDCNLDNNDCTPMPSGIGVIESTCPSPNCFPATFRFGDIVCATCTTPTSQQSCLTVGGGISASFSSILGLNNLNVTLNGKLEGRVCNTFAPSPGTCAQGFLCTTKCVSVCDVKRLVFTWSLFGGLSTEEVWKDEFHSCFGPATAVSSMSCTHTDCDDRRK